MKISKYLSFTSLRRAVSTIFSNLSDNRRQKSIKHSLHDAMMSGLACMYFQEPSLLQFQKRMEDERNSNNLRTMFDVQSIPSDSQLGQIIDSVPVDWHRSVFKKIISRLLRGKQLKDFQLFPGKYLIAVDGTQYSSSNTIHCNKCLVKEHRDGTTTYQHFALQASMMHPDKKQVFPIIAEDICNSDGQVKQDCEINAAKRLVVKLRQDHPKMGIILCGDDLFSRQPMIRELKEQKISFIFVAKPSSHTSMMNWLQDKQLSEFTEKNDNGNTIQYQWMNDVPLTGEKDAVRVNFILRTEYTQKTPEGDLQIVRRQSWVSDINVDADNVITLARGGLCRWKIESVP